MDLSRLLVHGMPDLARFFDVLDLLRPLLTRLCSCSIVLRLLSTYWFMLMTLFLSAPQTAADRLLSALSGHFAVKDLGALHYFLGLEVSRSSAGLTLTQHKYSLDLLRRAGMLQCKHATTPMSATDRLSALDGALLPSDDATEYRSIVGGLQYLTITRPDISYAVNHVSQYLHASCTIQAILQH